MFAAHSLNDRIYSTSTAFQVAGIFTILYLWIGNTRYYYTNSCFLINIKISAHFRIVITAMPYTKIVLFKYGFGCFICIRIPPVNVQFLETVTIIGTKSTE